MVCQQFGGINGICFYTSSIFESAGFPSDVGTIIYAILQIIITALGATLIDKVGRKPLLLEHEITSGAAPALALAGSLLSFILSLSGNKQFQRQPSLEQISQNYTFLTRFISALS